MCKIGSDFGSFEAKFVEIIFVFEDGKVVIESFNLIERPGIVVEKAVAESVFETIGGEIGEFVVSDRIEMIIGNFASKDAVFFELTHDRA